MRDNRERRVGWRESNNTFTGGLSMNSFTFCCPTRIVFGADTVRLAGKQVKDFGGTRVLIIYGGGSVVENGVLKIVTQSLEEEGIEYSCVGGVRPNPYVEFAQQIVDDFKDKKIDFILGVGGGSVLDTAKGVSYGLASPDTPIWDYFYKLTPVTAIVSVGAVLTIAAAGSETSISAVLTSQTTGLKRGVNSQLNRPSFAIMDPTLMYDLPPHQTACGITDILMHTLDRYFAPEADNALTDVFAEALMRVVIQNGRISMREPANYSARSELMWAGSLSHSDFTGLGRALDFSVHTLGNPVSSNYDIPHAESLSVMWPAWARFVYREDIPRFAGYARNVWGVSSDNDEIAAQTGINATEEYFRSIGMPVKLTDAVGDRVKDDIELLIDLCTYSGARIVGAFKVLSVEDIREIYRSAL